LLLGLGEVEAELCPVGEKQDAATGDLVRSYHPTGELTSSYSCLPEIYQREHRVVDLRNRLATGAESFPETFAREKEYPSCCVS
jgi:hypothetical protein